MNRIKRLYAAVGLACAMMAVTASSAFAVGTSQVDLSPLADDVTATLTANLVPALAVLALLVGVPVAIKFVRRIIGR